MVKALADRLAEAFAEYLHETAGANGTRPASRSEELIAESYRGIRPAPSATRPARPPRSELFDLLEAEPAGIELTESFAMLPGASVSGLYFGHPAARYFAVGRLTRPARGLRAAEGRAARRGRALALAQPGLRPALTG